MVRLLDFINRNGIEKNLWGAFYGNCEQSWADLYGGENTNTIEFDHITIWWNKHTMDEDMFKWMINESDHRTLNSNGVLHFHFYLKNRAIDDRLPYKE